MRGAQEGEEAARTANKEDGKWPNKKRARKDDTAAAGTAAAPAAGKPSEEAEPGIGRVANGEGWTEIGGLSRGMRKEAAREAREAARAREAAAKAAKVGEL